MGVMPYKKLARIPNRQHDSLGGILNSSKPVICSENDDAEIVIRPFNHSQNDNGNWPAFNGGYCDECRYWTSILDFAVCITFRRSFRSYDCLWIPDGAHS